MTKRIVLPLAFLLVTGFLFFANDNRHHWHEFRFLYSAANYTTGELMEGAFDPGPSPVRSVEDVAAWNATVLLHTYILKKVVNITGVGFASYEAIKALYAGIFIVAAALVLIALCCLGMRPAGTFLTASVLMISPLSFYLGFKMMGEVPSFFFASFALASFAFGLHHPRTSVSASVLSGGSLALSALASVRMPFLFLGFFAAVFFVGAPGHPRKRVAISGLIAIMTFMIFWPVGFSLMGGSFNIYYHAVFGFLKFSKPLPMWMFMVFNLGLFGMGMWLVLPMAFFSEDHRSLRFFGIWFMVSTVPVLIFSANFMEPRYLVTGLVPFAGLVSLGVEVLWLKAGRIESIRSARILLAGLFCLALVAGGIFAQRLMPYETDAKQLIRAVRTEAPSSTSTAILLPWNYTDYHLLRFVFPEKPIYLVQSAMNERGDLVYDPVWTQNRKEAYAHRYLPDAGDLAGLVEAKMIYIGWTILPSLQNLYTLLVDSGFGRLAALFESSPLMNHMILSWLWDDDRFELREFAGYGQYRVLEVRKRGPQPETGRSSSFAREENRTVPLWGMYEAEIFNDRNYSNPFVETELEVEFTSPSGRRYDFFGFYDGDGAGGQTGNVWKIRFMPMETGEWGWKAGFTDGAAFGSGRFLCTASSAPGPLIVDNENPRWLRTAGGGRFFPRWYYLHELVFTEEGQWQEDIERLVVEKGYNMVSVLTTQADHLVKMGWNRRKYETPFFYPWIRFGDTVSWNMFDIRSWHKLERVVRYLENRGIYVYFFDGFFPNIKPRFPDNAQKEALYLRYVLARIGAFRNITHNITFEFSEHMSPWRLCRIGRYIDSIDPFNHLVSAHDTQNYHEIVQGEAWIDFANLQYDMGRAGSSNITNRVVLSNFHGKPVAGTELVWEGRRKLDEEEIRKGAWGIVMAAGFFLYGEFGIGSVGVGDFGAGRAHAYLKILYDFIANIPYWTMRPQNELVDSGTFCLADRGLEYVVYAENGGPINIDLSSSTGTHTAEWLNPRTGEKIPIGEVEGGKILGLENPEGDSNDWVLHIKKSI